MIKKVKFEEMRPRQIVKARDEFPAIYIAVGPLEWHSYHMPYGNDGMRGYLLMVEVAKKCGGIVMPPYYMGTDADRTPEQRKRWGLPMKGLIYGMSQPALPLTSMYCSEELMFQILKMQLEWARDNGFKFAFVMPSHGGQGHKATCERAVTVCGNKSFQVEVVNPAEFMDEGVEYIEGHGRIGETELMLALRPELVDLNELPSGPLKVAEYGMLYTGPVVSTEDSPVNSDRENGILKVEMLVRNLSQKIKNTFQT